MKGPMEELRLKALEKSENKFRLLNESSPFPVILYDPDTFEIKEVNEAAANLYGYRFLRSHFHILASKEAIE